MATTTELTKTRYRSNATRLTAVARLANELLDLYSWENNDGRIVFTTEPNMANISSHELYDIEVKSAWAGLRAALILAGVISGDETPGKLPDGTAQFLRVQAQDKAGAGDVLAWRTVAVYEVFTGVNSYGYADGAALDVFFELKKAVAVRVLRQVLPIEARADYLANDVHSLISEAVIGLLPPFSVPNIAGGWACIGDFLLNPEPDSFGIDSPRLIVLDGNTGPAGPAGPQGEPGPVGTAGA